MAVSFSRPDPTSPLSVAEASFSTARRGFDQDEVRGLLEAVAAELSRLKDREDLLERELREIQDRLPGGAEELDEETVSRLLGEETLRVLQTARESASQIRVRAEESAAQILRDANEEANRLREHAETDVSRKRSDATADAEDEIAHAKQQGREMVNEARAYRERVLSELARRRELAREQIEQLVHGRDRLLQVFERARLVAVDVVAELEPLGEPDEYVDLSPTTGPVPMMVPSSKLGDKHAGPRVDDETLGINALEEQPTAKRGAIFDHQLDDVVVAAGAVPSPSVQSDVVDPESETVTPTQVAEDESAVEPVADEATVGDAPDAEDDSDTDAAVQSAGELDDDAAEATSSEAEAPAPSNVVMFPDRSVPSEHGEHAEEGDIDGLFERLRAGLSQDEATGAEPGEAPSTHESEPVAEPAGGSGADDGADTDDSDDSDAAPTVFDRRDEALTPLIVTGARKLKRVLADEQNDVLDALRQNEAITELGEVLPELDEQAQRYVDAIHDELLDAAVAGGLTLSRSKAATLRKAMKSNSSLDAASQAIVRDLIRPLRERLDRSVSEGSGDNDDITKRVRSVYREWKTQHIDDQLDDAFRLAYGGGALAAAKPGTPLCWSVDPNGPACPDAEDNALAGAVPAGEGFPTGHVSAPAHAGCRCVLVADER